MYNLIVNDKIVLEENGEIIEQYEYNKNALEGNIYIGKVKNVLKGMEASFVDIGEAKNALLRSDKYTPNTSLIVQVKKEPTNMKGAIVSDKIQLSGKYIILLPTDKFISISNKIKNQEELKRLKNLVQSNLKEYGAIIRTAAQGETTEIIKEMHDLIELWKNLSKKEYKAPKLIYEEDRLKKVIKGLTDKNISKIITTKKNEVEKTLDALKLNIPIEEKESYIKTEDLRKRTVWLKSGGCIKIDETEALVAIDVNSGSYTGKDDFETTAEKINKEATIEIAKQIRLRNLRGIIIVDYINLESEKAKKEIVEILQNEIKKDRSKVEIFGFTKLGLLELTRKQL